MHLIIATMLVFGGAEQETELKSSVGDPDKPQYAFTSKFELKKDGTLITDAAINGLASGPLMFSLRSGMRGTLPPATKDGNAVKPRSLTATRTTHRTVTEVSDSFKGTAKAAFEMPASGWSEIGGWPKARLGARLEACLYDGGADGKPVVKVKSEAEAGEKNVYKVAYTVENSSVKTITFEWAGLKGTVEPRKSFVKVESPDDAPTEEPAVFTFHYGDKEEFGFRTSVWSRKK
jgi:hypothetical protein